MQLVRVEGDQLGGGSGVHPGDGGLTRRGETVLQQGYRRPRRQAGRGHGDVHVGDQVLCGLEGRDRAPELLAHHRVVDGPLQCRVAHSDEVERQQHRRRVRDPVQLVVGNALVAAQHHQAVLDGYVVEVQACGALPAHHRQRVGAQPGAAQGHDEHQGSARDSVSP